MATTTQYRQRKTPGVYITELSAFPPSIVGVETAVPIFIGYTEKANLSGAPMYLKPLKIGSLADYQAVYGEGFEPQYQIDAATANSYDFRAPDGSGGYTYYNLVQTGSSQFNLYNSLRMFYNNGGGVCYIVSVGNYTDSGQSPNGVSVAYADLEKGLKAADDQVGPTMIVIPDATLLPSDGQTTNGVPTSSTFGQLTTLMLKSAGLLKDRVAILDVYGTQAIDQNGDAYSAQLEEAVTQFWTDVGDDYLSYGMGYFPFLNTSIVPPDEIDYTNFADGGGTTLADLLTAQAQIVYKDKPEQLTVVEGYIGDMATTTSPPEAVTKLNQNLTNALPILQEMENLVAKKMGLLPPSGTMAGIFTAIDSTRGVWNAPANTTLTSVLSPTLKLNDAQQGELNVPLNGKAVDVIREFVGRGSVVWGARTLDGNSNDYRYIQIRRTLIYIEQSVKNALDQFVFAANNAKTWVTVTSSISNFLQGVWSAGGLMGATASEAYGVECGLGSTMTSLDILEGYMIVQVTLQMIHPAEFIELTFKQKMGELGG